MKNTKNQVLTIPQELSEQTRNIKFAYVALRNLLYALHVCSVNAQEVKGDFSVKANSIVSSYMRCINENKINLFKDDVTPVLFADTLTSFDRNMINKNEQIVILKNSLSSTPTVDKYQLLMLFCHICVECSLQLSGETTLTEMLTIGVIKETEKKMLLNLGKNLEAFFTNEIVSLYKAL